MLLQSFPISRKKWKPLRLQLCILHHVVVNGQATIQEYMPRLRIPEPFTYGGARDLKEVENFLVEIEQYLLPAILKTGHIMDIRDMSEKDKLFTFMERLILWARTELQTQKVADVSTTMKAGECLMNYQSKLRKDWLQVNSQSREG
ncbi:Retrotrans gag domain-containing protein [Abeliophyllum distichum]|uniref:Retrotrans gag domain-containing protein n=1 Tax=Abeliophyllum distichum TaxID=126358 RepID=A0ABD1UN46_9LAMI